MSARLSLVTTSYPRFHDDTAGRFVAASVHGLRSLGVDVEVFAPDHLLASAPNVTWLRHAPLRHQQSLCFGDGMVPNLRASPWRGLLVPPLLQAVVWALRRRRQRPVIAHWLVPAALGAVIAGCQRIVAVAHGSDVALLERLPGAQALAQQLAQRTQLVFASHDLQQRFAALAGTTVGQVLPPTFLAVTRIAQPQARAALGLGPQQRVVVFVGRLLATKGVDVLLDAVATLVPRPVLLVAGDGPERAALEELARARAVATRFLGRWPPSRLGELLGAANVLAIPSRPNAHGHAEGLPTVLLEAWSAGCAVVVSDVGGLGERVWHGVNGMLVPPGDPHAWARALQTVLDDTALCARLAAAGPAAARPLEPEAHGRALLTLLAGVRTR